MGFESEIRLLLNQQHILKPKITTFVKTKVYVNKKTAFHNVKEIIHIIVKTIKQVYNSS